MADKTGIEWTDSTWNPVVGCDRVSPGCDNCYAIGQANRIVGMAEASGKPTPYQGTVVQIGPPRGDTRLDWSGLVKTLPERLDQPIRWRRPRRIFVNSMSDLFHPDVPADFIYRVFAVMRLAPRHQFQVLTKRPRRMLGLLNAPTAYGSIWRAARELAAEGRIPQLTGAVEAAFDPALYMGENPRWPFPNVWLGTSIESDKYTYRAKALAATPAAVRFVSAEPLLGPLPSLDLEGIDWVIVGGESGPGARPMHPDWARDLRDRCVDSGTPFLFKQWGAWVESARPHADEAEPVYPDPATTRGLATWMVRVGKRQAGRELDGRNWDEYPA